MAHPAELYARYLLLRAKKKCVADVQKSFRVLGFPEVQIGYLEDLRDALNVPIAFDLEDPNSSVTRFHLRRLEVLPLWKADDGVREALRLLPQPQVRETLQLMLMGRLPHHFITARIFQKFDTHVSPEAIQHYRHFFWNVDRVSTSEWVSYLSGNPLSDHYMACLFGSPAQALYRAGFKPKVNGKEILLDALRIIQSRLEATRMLPDTVDTARQITSLAKQANDLYVTLYSNGAGMEDALKDLANRFRVNREPASVIALKDLAANGTHSNDRPKHSEHSS